MTTQQTQESDQVLTRPDIPHAEPKLGKVAVLYTTPETVIEDYARLLDLADIDSALLPDRPNMLKVNISWQHYYPACSSAPWQIEGVARKMQANGFTDITAAHNGTIVVDPIEGRAKNKHGVVEDALGLKHIVLDMPPVRWVAISALNNPY